MAREVSGGGMEREAGGQQEGTEEGGFEDGETGGERGDLGGEGRRVGGARRRSGSELEIAWGRGDGGGVVGVVWDKERQDGQKKSGNGGVGEVKGPRGRGRPPCPSMPCPALPRIAVACLSRFNTRLGYMSSCQVLVCVDRCGSMLVMDD